jgi:FK506-binding nuclear protein
MAQGRDFTKRQSSGRRRSVSEYAVADTEQRVAKKQKTLVELEGAKDQDPPTAATASIKPHEEDAVTIVVASPKSKKELRAERKRARRTLEDPEFVTTLQHLEEKAIEKERNRQELKRLIQQERNETKLRQLKKQHREKNAPGGGGGGSEENTRKQQQQSKKKQGGGSSDQKGEKPVSGQTEEDEVARKIIDEIKHGKSDSSGWTTLPLGVKFKDVVVGKGPVVPNKCLLTVKYKLTGGKFGAVIDSSKNFKFRLGKGEVVQGWEIGLQGMREGGQRKLIVPPKAGYGSQDIGAGPGGLLHFDVTVLSFQ